MKNTFLILLLAQITFLSFGQTKTEKTVLDLSKRKFQWITGKQLDSLSSVLDENVRYIHSNGWIQTKKDVIDDFSNGKLDYQKIDIKEANVRLYDNTAIVTGRGMFSGVVSGTPFLSDLTFTEVYVNKKGRWLLASRHANKMP